MTYIRAMCPDCGEIELVPDDVQLRVRPNDGGTFDLGVHDHVYVFECPGCRCYVIKPADRRIFDLLLAAGVPRPAEHPERPPGGPRLTYDDLIDFHLLLEEEEWFLSL